MSEAAWHTRRETKKNSWPGFVEFAGKWKPSSAHCGKSKPPPTEAPRCTLALPVERALREEQECTEVLQLVAACRGALNGLMGELVEGHIRFHVLDPDRAKDSPQAAAAEELIDIVRSHLK